MSESRGFEPPHAAMLPDGRRLHLQHGPIDLIVEARGSRSEVRAAYAQARAAFPKMLPDLATELTALRRPLDPSKPLRGTIAKRMARAVRPHRDVFVTPMVAVAGAVADEMLAVLTANRALRAAYVNNGGDIALHLAPGEQFDIGVVATPAHARVGDTMTIDSDTTVRGLATSGRHGRSASLGIADAVTTLAADAASADAAATLIANAINIDHESIVRAPARELDADSDLGDRLVTVAVGALPEYVIDTALARGAALAERMIHRGLVHSALLTLAGRKCIVGCTRSERQLANTEDRA